MSDEPAPRPRGRPRNFDADAALQSALLTFWSGGYTATSVEDLSNATGLNRPSLYGAFGDKRDLYLTALDRYRELARQTMAQELAGPGDVREALMRVYRRALSMYFPSGQTARGCMMIGTAATESVTDAGIRAHLNAGLREIDDAFAARFAQAIEAGELPAGSDPRMLALLASAVLHTLAVRSRAGDPRATLLAVAQAGVDMICR